MRQRIIAENAAQSDIFISTPGDAFTLGNQGYLADIPWDQVPSAANVDQKFKYKQIGIWGYDFHAIGFNPDYLSYADAPKSWKELADPKWKGKIGMPVVTDDTASRPMMVMSKAYGEDQALQYLQSMYDNATVLFDTPGRLESSIATGQSMVTPHIPSAAATWYLIRPEAMFS